MAIPSAPWCNMKLYMGCTCCKVFFTSSYGTLSPGNDVHLGLRYLAPDCTCSCSVALKRDGLPMHTQTQTRLQLHLHTHTHLLLLLHLRPHTYTYTYTNTHTHPHTTQTLVVNIKSHGCLLPTASASERDQGLPADRASQGRQVH